MKPMHAALLCCALLASACTGTAPDSGSAAWRGAVDTLAGGTVRVSNPADGVWPAGGGWRLVEELRIGRMDGTGPDVFGQVAAVGVSPAGEIHVIDGQAQEIRVFAADGTHLHTIGRRGSGPGEFAGAYGLVWDRDGRLLVVDGGNARYGVFTPDGTLSHHVQRQVPGVVQPWLGGRDDDGALYDAGIRPVDASSGLFVHYRVGSDGAVLDSFPGIASLRGSPSLSLSLFRLRPRLILAFDGRGYLWSAHTDEYRLIQRTLSGDTVRIITRAFRRAPVTAADIARIRDELADPALAGAPPELRNPELPTLRPALDRIYVADDGHVFVQSVGDGAAPPPLDVFDPDGRYLGPLAADFHLLSTPALPLFREGRVWGVVEDSLGVLHVLRARIERGG